MSRSGSATRDEPGTSQEEEDTVMDNGLQEIAAEDGTELQMVRGGADESRRCHVWVFAAQSFVRLSVGARAL
jgi:hypothetical protein